MGGTVTFHHHEAVGAKLTRKRLRGAGLRRASSWRDVSELVRLSGRFKGYADGWSDAAVRRYARDAGPLLGDLNELVRCDCTTRNRAKADRLQEQVDDLERRIGELAAEDRRRAERPAIDGNRVMALLGIPPGPLVGEAMAYLLALKRSGEATDESDEAASGPAGREEVGWELARPTLARRARPGWRVRRLQAVASDQRRRRWSGSRGCGRRRRRGPGPAR